MLTIISNKNPSGAVDYFTRSLSKDDYFFSRKSIEGRYHGKLAVELDCPDVVSKRSFSRLVHRRHPVTGKSLAMRSVPNSRSSYELCFNAVKSASIAMGFGDKDVLHIHRRAVRAAMKEVEKDVRTQVRIEGRNTYLRTGNIVYARFDHFTARPVKDENLGKYISEPQLHSHCVVPNLTIYKGKIRALEMSEVKKMGSFYEAIYHNEMAKGLQKAGYIIERTKDKYEIKGISKILDKFSSRSREIEALAKKLGITDAKQKSNLAARSRVSKSKVKEDASLIQAWKERLTTAELSAIKSAKGKPILSHLSITPEQSIKKALSHHLERTSTVAVKRLMATALSYGYGKFRLKEVQKAFGENRDIVSAKVGYQTHCTTKQMIALENKMISFASGTRGTYLPIHPDYKINRDFLNAEQRAGIKSILESRDRVVILIGGAGVGKSTLLQSVREAASAKGKTVRGFAPSSAASRIALQDKGFMGADTVSMLLKNRTLQKELKDQIILVDEAGMLSSRDMSGVFRVAQEQNCRVILSGDPRQNSSPSAGQALKLLQEKAGLTVVQVDKIVRQRGNAAYKKAVRLMADGKIKQGFAALDKIGAVKQIEDEELRNLTLAKNYVESLEAGRTVLSVAPTHAEIAKVNSAIRLEMKARGRISKMEREVMVLESLNLSATQKRDSVQYETGSIIKVHQNIQGGIKAGEQYEVSHLKDGNVYIKNATRLPFKLPLEQAERFGVFTKKNMIVAKGEHIRITGNGKTKDGKRIYNGQSFIVDKISREGNIHLKGGKVLDSTYGHISYSYCSTSHAVQGKDSQDVLVAQSAMSFPASNKKQAYVTSSRGTERITIYTDDKEALRNAITKTGDEISATTLSIKHRTQELFRRYKRAYDKLKKSREYGTREKPPGFTRGIQRKDRGRSL